MILKDSEDSHGFQIFLYILKALRIFMTIIEIA